MSYSVFGLNINSSRPLPLLSSGPSSNAADVTISLGPISGWLRKTAQSAVEVWFTSPFSDNPHLTIWKIADGRYYRFLYSTQVEFFVDGAGTQIWISCPSSLNLDVLVDEYLSPFFPFVLSLRGVTCLHASALVVGGRALALIGPKGVGKTTTTTSLAIRGFPVLSDDTVSLSERDGNFWVNSSYPYLRLSADTAEYLFADRSAKPRLQANRDKQILNLIENGFSFAREPYSLGAVYLLGERSNETGTPYVRGLPRQRALVALLANRLLKALPGRERRAKDFVSLGRLVSTVPVLEITPHACLFHLPELCDLVLKDFEARVS